MHAQPEVGDEAVEQRAARVVDLHRHEPRRHLHHVRGEAQLTQRVGRLQPEQPAPDDDARPPSRPGARGRGLGGGAHPVEVVEGAVDEHAVEVAAGDGRDEGHAARREHQLVVVDGAAALRRDPARRPVHGDRGVVEVELDERVGVLVGERQVVLARVADVGRQRDPVVGRARLLGEDDDAPGALGLVAPAQALDEPVADHAVADDDDGARFHWVLPPVAREHFPGL